MPMRPVRRGFRFSPILGTPALRRVGWSALREQNVAVGWRGAGDLAGITNRRAVDLQAHRAVEDVEVCAVGAKCVEPQVIFGQWLDHPIDLVLAVVQLRGKWPQVLDHTLD